MVTGVFSDNGIYKEESWIMRFLSCGINKGSSMEFTNGNTWMFNNFTIYKQLYKTLYISLRYCFTVNIT